LDDSATYPKNTRDVIKQIWFRARINAFAHKQAMLEYSRKQTYLFRNTVLTSLGSILSIVFVYIISTSTFETINIVVVQFRPATLIVFFTFLAIILTILSLYLGIMNNHGRYGIRAEEHKN